MGESNEDWGDQRDPSRAEAWNRVPALPDSGQDRLLDRLLADKHLTVADLVRIGTRWESYAGGACLTWLFPDGRKWRRLSDGRRFSEEGVGWKHFKRVRSPAGAEEAIIAEGETDAATLARLFPAHDILIVPNGARNVTKEMIQLAALYGKVYVALDADEAGDAGAERLMSGLANAARLRPPEGVNDWNEAWTVGRIEEGADLSSLLEKVPPKRRVFTLQELVDAQLGTYEENHWFSAPILPVRGQCVIHAQKKSLKSFVLLEMMRSLTTGSPFLSDIKFARAEPAKVLMVQLEIPPYDLRNRVVSYADTLSPESRKLFLANGTVLHMADGDFPRVKVTSPRVQEYVREFVAESGASVVLFDPIQRILGGTNANQMHEIDVLLDLYEQLQHDGLTVVYCAHNNKTDRDAKGGHAIVGSQRFSGDADSVCSIFHEPKFMIDDDNEQGIKQRNILFESRSGRSLKRGITVSPSDVNDELPVVEFGPPHGDGGRPDGPAL